MSPPAAVLLDALGTLLRMEPPAPLLVAALDRRSVRVSEAQAAEAIAAEIVYYRGHIQSGRDQESLHHLRDRCTRVLAEHLPAAAAQHSDLRAALLESLRFTAYPEVPAVLRKLRAGGARLVVVSNWDCSLHEVLGAAGLADLVDGVVTSAEHGAAKPDARIFEAGLRLAGVPARLALHAGDDLQADYLGARAAGLEAVLVVRDGRRKPRGVDAIDSLSGLLTAPFQQPGSPASRTRVRPE